MIKIEMGNIVSKIHNVSINIENIILNKLNYEIGGFGIAKETKYLYNPKTKILYTGLVPYVVNIFNNLNLKYEIIDRRKKPLSNASFKISDDFKARDYQAEIINNASSREIIQAATGAGKTFIMAALTAKFNTKPVLIVAPKVSLAFQIKDEFEKFLNVKVGIIGGGNFDIQDIIVCTPQSVLNYKNGEIIKKAKVIMFDEVHFIASNILQRVAHKAVNAYYRIGVSATPWRDSGDDMLIEAALNVRKPHLSINASKLIKEGKLTPCEINFIPINSNIKWLGSYSKTYNEAIVNNDYRNNKIIEITKECILNDKTILLLINKIDHGNKLLNKIKSEIGYKEKVYYENNKKYTIGNVEFVSGEDDFIRRKLVFQSIKEGFTKIMIGSTIADEGLDVPKLDALILCGSGKSSTRAFQRVGRVLRLYPNKEKALVFDFMDLQPTFYKHFLYRKALYETEPLWEINYKEI